MWHRWVEFAKGAVKGTQRYKLPPSAAVSIILDHIMIREIMKQLSRCSSVSYKSYSWLLCPLNWFQTV